MKRTLIKSIDGDIPFDIKKLTVGAVIFDSSSSTAAKVYYIDRDDGYYLKKSDPGSLRNEALMTEYFHAKGLGAAVLSYVNDGVHDWMLTSRVAGEDCTHGEYISDPKRLCDLTAMLLRKLHDTDFSDCPIKDRMSSYISLAEENYNTGNYDSSHFPDNFGYRTADEAYSVFESGRSALKNEVLLHGDYCLPNIMLDSWSFSGFIDLGGGGVGDRHIDLFWGAWSLSFNLGTDEYRNRFFDAYGRELVDEEKLKIIAAAEVFG